MSRFGYYDEQQGFVPLDDVIPVHKNDVRLIPTTNADKIRLMSEEDMALWLMNFSGATVGSGADARKAMYRGRLLEWLREETNDD